MKSSNLRHWQACSQNKGLIEYQRRASRLWAGPSLASWRQRGGRVTARAGRRGAISAPGLGSSTKLRAGSQLLTKSSWDPGRLTYARRVTARGQLPEDHTAYVRRHFCLQPGNRGGGMGEVIGCTAHLGRACSASTWSPELLGLGKGTKCWPN